MKFTTIEQIWSLCICNQLGGLSLYPSSQISLIMGRLGESDEFRDSFFKRFISKHSDIDGVKDINFSAVSVATNSKIKLDK